MAAIAQDSLRRPAVATILVLALLGIVAVPTYRFVGPIAALLLVIGGSLVLVAVLLRAAGRQLHRTQNHASFAEHALEAVPRALFISDALEPGQPNRFVNTAYCALTGYGRNEAVSDGFDAVAVFADAANISALARGLATRVTSAATLRRSDGTTVPVKLDLCLVAGDGDRYLVGLLEDSSIEPAPQSSIAAQAAATAAAVDSGIGPKNAFLSWLTHELRSPLNACVMWLDVLALAPQADKLAQAVDAIKRNLTRQTRLVNDLSDAAKVQSGSLEVRPQPLDVIELVKSHLDAWQLLAIGKQLAFAHRIEPAVAVIDGDAGRLLQTLNHLVENAIASTPSGGRVQLRVQLIDATCVVEVEDSGAGLSPDDAANLGTPLWRAPATSKSRPGLGLGLAIAHHLAAQHGGTLQATSKTGGALFTLALPLAASPRDGARAAQRDFER